MGSLSLSHWLVVAVIVLILFRPTRLAAAGKGLGEGLRNLRKGVSDHPPGE
jgi:sec-independent protein translocase protein TatA